MLLGGFGTLWVGGPCRVFEESQRLEAPNPQALIFFSLLSLVENARKTSQAKTRHKGKPLTIEKLIQDMSKQQDLPAVLGGDSQPAPPATDVQHQSTTPPVREPEPSRVRSRERTPARQPRSVTPQREAQPRPLQICF